jgi:hypothetical protein
VFQEFSNEERCRAAKATLEGSLKDAGAKLRSGLEDLKRLGKAHPALIIIAYNVECLPKKFGGHDRATISPGQAQRCGSLFLDRTGLAPPTPCRSPGAPV